MKFPSGKKVSPRLKQVLFGFFLLECLLSIAIFAGVLAAPSLLGEEKEPEMPTSTEEVVRNVTAQLERDILEMRQLARYDGRATGISLEDAHTYVSWQRDEVPGIPGSRKAEAMRTPEGFAILHRVSIELETPLEITLGGGTNRIEFDSSGALVTPAGSYFVVQNGEASDTIQVSVRHQEPA